MEKMETVTPKVTGAPRRPDVRNIAIIAHVDHGKTTLVDALFRQTGEFKVKADQAQECLMDSNPQERERGITILAKCTSVQYGDTRINIVDTPGHADFGSEVERILTMVDGVLLLIDALDGPMPQTRFVLRKSLELGLRPVVVINKVDRPFADPAKALNNTFDLFVDLGASEQQLDFPIVYASGKNGWATLDLKHPTTDLKPLFETILRHVPGPVADPQSPLQMLTTMVDYSSYVGRIAIGRILAGTVSRNQSVMLMKTDGRALPMRATRIYGFFGLERREIEKAFAGDIVAIAGMEEARVGDTVADAENPVALPPMLIDEPTLSVEFMVNDSPFSGRDGKFLTSRHLRERLEQEVKTNVGLRVEELTQNTFKVSGRGELHLSVLIETMRREGFELAVSRPQVILKTENGKTLEPAEYLVVDIEQSYQGAVMENLGKRGLEIKNMHAEGGGTRLRIEGVIAARALIGFKSEFLAQTKGTGLMHHSFHGYIPRSNVVTRRLAGVLIAKESGLGTSYALESLQARSVLFVAPGTDIYAGMIVGQNARENDMIVNPCKKKALTNMRAAGSDDLVQLTPPRIFSLEQAMAYIEEDELAEITPKTIRLRKKELDHSRRRKSEKEEEEG
ncbi:MAG TPA: translational GTPase TypA [Elusimicrobiota bacterium]|nr:translational GTPase TypA [Elusimicrobiota bacterium]